MLFKAVYGHWLGHPWPNKRREGWVYARVVKLPGMLPRIYFESSRDKMLRKNPDGSHYYADVLRHELEHVFQHIEIKHFSIKYAWESVKIFFKTGSVYRAYHDNRFEVAAREAEKKGLPESFAALFE